jgi:hypothetical protein
MLLLSSLCCSIGGHVVLHVNKAAPSAYQTVQSCVDAAGEAAGAHVECRIAAGTYHEAVTISSSSSASVTVVGAGPNQTILTGVEAITNVTWFKTGENNIYSTVLPEALRRIDGAGRSVIQQLFIDGQMAFEAREPNANLSSVLDANTAWFTSTNSSSPRPVSNGSSPNLGYISHPAVAASGTNWTGALLTLNVGSRVWTWTRRVLRVSRLQV